MPIDGPGFFGWFGHAFFIAMQLLVGGVMLIVFIGLTFLVVRFLLVVTKAAQVYVDQHSAAASAPTAEPTAAVPTATEPLPNRVAKTPKAK